MMTAGQIAKELGIGEVTINYILSEYLCKYLLENDPMTEIEWRKNDFNFKQMKSSRECFKTEDFFP